MNKECFFDKVNKECWVGGGVPREQRVGEEMGGGGRRFGSSPKHKKPVDSVSGRSETGFFGCIFFSQNNEGEEEEDNLFFV